MDLKDFQNVNHEEEAIALPKKNGKKNIALVDSEFHNESDKIIKDLEARIAALNKPATVNTDNSKPDNAIEEVEEKAQEEAEDIETVVINEGQGGTFLDKIRPFILPIFLTIFALIFAAIFIYFFSQSRVEKSAQAIVNNQSQPVEITIRNEEKPVSEIVVIPEKVIPECDQETQYLDEEINECVDFPPQEEVVTKAVFENGTTTVVKVRFAYDKYNYDNYPRGIYLLGGQIFGEEGEYEDFKLLPTSRPNANDMFFGIDRYMVSLLGACQYVVDEADILVSNMNDSQGDQVYSAIKDKYFRGNVEKIIEASKPHVVCGK